MKKRESQYWLTRFAFQRALACIYLVAFLIIANQFTVLVGSKGFLPADTFIKDASFWQAPSIFQLLHTDGVLTICGWLGVALSLIALTSVSERFGKWGSVLVWGTLWFLYLSFVNIGGRFYAFGSESVLLEAGFLAIFLGSRDQSVPTIGPGGACPRNRGVPGFP